MLKRVGVYIIWRDYVVVFVCALVGWNKTNKRCTVHAVKYCILICHQSYPRGLVCAIDIIPLLSSSVTIVAFNDVVTVTDKWYSMKLCPGLNKLVLLIEDCWLKHLPTLNLTSSCHQDFCNGLNVIQLRLCNSYLFVLRFMVNFITDWSWVNEWHSCNRSEEFIGNVTTPELIVVSIMALSVYHTVMLGGVTDELAGRWVWPNSW
jgi:hypothetical protein